MTEKNRMRDKKIQVWMSEEECKILHEKCAETNLTISDFIRNLLETGVIVNRDTFAIKDVLNEINRIGTNINQVAKIVNTNGSVNKNDFEELKEQYEQLFDIYIEKVLHG